MKKKRLPREDRYKNINYRYQVPSAYLCLDTDRLYDIALTITLSFIEKNKTANVNNHVGMYVKTIIHRNQYIIFSI